MPKIMLINVTHPEESRVGIVNNGVLESFEIESFAREHLKGNIYKGVVHRIHPALEAAFVDIGGERDAFLPLDEICFKNLPSNGHVSNHEGRPRIKEILKPGQQLLVQIVKDEFASKPPTLSTFFSLPGRYLVLLPGSDESGISRKIEGEERARLRTIIDELDAPEGFGVIVRTAAVFDETKQELQRDLTYLRRLWDNIQQGAGQKHEPGLVYREHDLVMRNIRDYFTPDIDEIYVDNEDVFQRARDFLHNVMPGKEHLLRIYKGDQPIFSAFNVEAEIESIYKRRVSLRSGGSIVIDGTEALTAIDVNSGGSVRGGNQEETAFRTNMEAASEIGRQLRLRDLGGLIVIDFIDMRQAAHNRDVEQTLRTAMKPDKARHDIGHISRFGLLEISRQRLRPAASATSYTSCPFCEGHGLVRTTESAALVALRKVHNRIAQGDAAVLKVSLPEEVALYLLNQKRDDLALLESRYEARIQIAMNPKLMPHQSEFEVRVKTEAQRAPVNKGPRPGEVAEPVAAAVVAPKAATPAANGAAVHQNGNGDGKKKRRRGRRRGRGRGRQAALALVDALTSLSASAGLYAPTPEVMAAMPQGDDEDYAEGEESTGLDAGEAEEGDEGEEYADDRPSAEPQMTARAVVEPRPAAVAVEEVEGVSQPVAAPAAKRSRSRGSRGGQGRSRSKQAAAAPRAKASEPAPKAKAAPKRTAAPARKAAPKKSTASAAKAAPRKRPIKKTSE